MKTAFIELLASAAIISAAMVSSALADGPSVPPAPLKTLTFIGYTNSPYTNQASAIAWYDSYNDQLDTAFCGSLLQSAATPENHYLSYSLANYTASPKGAPFPAGNIWEQQTLITCTFSRR